MIHINAMSIFPPPDAVLACRGLTPGHDAQDALRAALSATMATDAFRAVHGRAPQPDEPFAAWAAVIPQSKWWMLLSRWDQRDIVLAIAEMVRRAPDGDDGALKEDSLAAVDLWIVSPGEAYPVCGIGPLRAVERRVAARWDALPALQQRRSTVALLRVLLWATLSEVSAPSCYDTACRSVPVGWRDAEADAAVRAADMLRFTAGHSDPVRSI